VRIGAFASTFDALAVRYLGRHLSAADGVPPEELERHELRLGVRLPDALRAYMEMAGAVPEWNTIHNRFFSAEQLCFEDDFLIFMDENQGVVSWGIPRAELARADPPVWQRTNALPPDWYSEDRAFTAFLGEMFAWYEQSGIWGKRA